MKAHFFTSSSHDQWCDKCAMPLTNARMHIPAPTVTEYPANPQTPVSGPTNDTPEARKDQRRRVAKNAAQGIQQGIEGRSAAKTDVEYSDAAHAAAKMIAEDGQVMTADDIRSIIGDITPGREKAYGAIVESAAKAAGLRHLDMWTRSRSVSRNGGPVAVWGRDEHLDLPVRALPFVDGADYPVYTFKLTGSTDLRKW